MNVTIELCSVCKRSPANRIVYRNGDLLICDRFCAMQTIGLTKWNEWFEAECRHRIEHYKRKSNVREFKAK